MSTTKNLGPVRGVWYNINPPVNTKILWYDINVGVNVMKYYDVGTTSWLPLYPNQQESSWVLNVKDLLNTPPVSPTIGDRYLINVAPTGVWSGKQNKIATWDGLTWSYYTPTVSDALLVDSYVGQIFIYNGTSWDIYPLNGGVPGFSRRGTFQITSPPAQFPKGDASTAVGGIQVGNGSGIGPSIKKGDAWQITDNSDFSSNVDNPFSGLFLNKRDFIVANIDNASPFNSNDWYIIKGSVLNSNYIKGGYHEYNTESERTSFFTSNTELLKNGMASYIVNRGEATQTIFSVLYSSSLAIDKLEERLFVLGITASQLGVYRVQDGAAIAAISATYISQYRRAVVLSLDQSKLYWTDNAFPGDGLGCMLRVMNTEDYTQIATIQLPTAVPTGSTTADGNDATQIIFNLDGSKAYVLCHNASGSGGLASSTVVVVNLITNTVIARLSCPGGCEKGVISNDGSFVYVICRNDGTVRAIDTSTDTIADLSLTPSIPGNFASGTDILISPEDDLLYIASRGQSKLYVVDIVGLTTSDISGVGVGPSALLYDNKQQKIYCRNADSNTTSIIEGGVVTATISGMNLIQFDKTGEIAFGISGVEIYVYNLSTNTFINSIYFSAGIISFVYSNLNGKLFVSSYIANSVIVIEDLSGLYIHDTGVWQKFEKYNPATAIKKDIVYKDLLATVETDITHNVFSKNISVDAFVGNDRVSAGLTIKIKNIKEISVTSTTTLRNVKFVIVG